MKGSATSGKKKLWGGVGLVLLIAIVLCAKYLQTYYSADEAAVAAFSSADGVETQALDSGAIVYLPEDPKAGLIFYPGGKVEYTAYSPLMEACASAGILCVLPEMPFHLAVLDVDAAEGIQQQFPEIETWYIGGHSLGGAMAASYLAEHTDAFQGLVLLGAYATADLSDEALKVLSVWGSEDGVMNRKKYEKNKENLPADFTELVIEGGCHAYFGMYGEQDGDGIPSISNQEQIAITAMAIADLIN